MIDRTCPFTVIKGLLFVPTMIFRILIRCAFELRVDTWR
jgi:hypothetical protein